MAHFLVIWLILSLPVSLLVAAAINAGRGPSLDERIEPHTFSELEERTWVGFSRDRWAS